VTGAKEELELLHDSIADTRGKSKDHELRTAPIITRDAYVAAGYREGATQYGVLGSVLSIQSAFRKFPGSTTDPLCSSKNITYKPVNPQLYVNTVCDPYVNMQFRLISPLTHRMHPSLQ
jgi:hypothetical protein